MMFVRALRDGGHEANLFVRMAHQYGYEYDFLYDGPKSERKKVAKTHILNSDILHFKGDHMPFTGAFKILRDMHPPPSVVTFGGSGFRRRSPDLPPETCQHWYPVGRYRAITKAMSAITPDLMYAPDIMLTPHAHPEVKPTYIHRKVPIIGHSPSNREKKGTNNLFLPALDILRSRGVKFDTMVIEGATNAECIERKSQCSVFFDQGVLSAYGMSAVEAMMRGIPVVTRMSDEVKEKDPAFAGSPLLLFDERSPEVLADKLQEAVESNLQDLSRRTYEWAMSMHSYAPVTSRLMELYRRAYEPL